MSKQLVQTVYLPVENFKTSKLWLSDKETDKIEYVKEKEGIFFTVEEYNAKMKEVIEETLKNGAENANVKDFKVNYTGVRAGGFYIKEVVDKDSITNTFEETYLKYKI